MDEGTENHSTVDNLQSYASRFFPVSSNFEDGFENSYGYSEKSMIQAWNSQHFQGESMLVVANGSPALDGLGKSGSSVIEYGYETLCGSNGKKVIQTLDSQYCRGETMVVVARGSCPLDQGDQPESGIDDRPLGLPVRSLKSRIEDTDSPEPVGEGRSRSSSRTASSKSSGKVRNRKLGNSEEKLKQTVALPSPIPWRSRSGRMEIKEEALSFHSHSHSMPPQYEEHELEQLRSQSFQSSTSFSSLASSVSSSPGKLSPSSSASSELGRKRSPYGSSDATSPSPPGQTNGKVSGDRSRSRQHFDGSASEVNEQRRDEQVSNREWQPGSMKYGMKPGPPHKYLSRGRSVRTFRSSELTTEARKGRNRIDDSVGKTYIKAEEVPVEKSEMKTEVLDNPFSKHQKGEMQESEDKAGGEAHNFSISSDEEVASNIVSDDEEHVPYEVDKKAGEFIAKFKEQIRLQKIESFRGHTWETHL